VKALVRNHILVHKVDSDGDAKGVMKLNLSSGLRKMTAGFGIFRNIASVSIRKYLKAVVR